MMCHTFHFLADASLLVKIAGCTYFSHTSTEVLRKLQMILNDRKFDP